MSKIILPLLLVLLTITSCQKDRWKNRLTNRIEGHWTYEKAKYQAKTFQRQDRLEEYKNDHVYFKKDGTLEIINEVDNTYLSGIYSFERTTNNNNNWDNDYSTSTTYQVQISLTDTTSNELYQELWDQFRITKKVIRFELEEASRPFYFKLCKKDN